MEFKRKLLGELEAWRSSPFRKPLVIRGARQTGKTTVVHQFARGFDTYIYLNLEKDEDKRLFGAGLGVRDTFQMICFEKNVSAQGDTLLFIDEIQNSPEAVMQLRYFYEEMPQVFVIGAGSLLEVVMDIHSINFPVGRVEYRYLFPMDFEEFLLSMGEHQSVELLSAIPVPRFAHQKLLQLFRLYTFVGGMPEALARYQETGDFLQVEQVYEALFTAYKDDVSKYARTATERTLIRHLIETAPHEVGRRVTFEKFGNSGYKSREVSAALRTLERAMLLYLRYPVTSATVPLFPDLKLHPHLQFLDSGLLNHVLRTTGLYFKDEDLSAVFQGCLAEQVVGQELLAQWSTRCEKPLFWTREKRQSNAEVDYLVVHDGVVVPVEVKSGKSGTLRSLHSFIENSNTDIGIRLYSGEYSVERNTSPAKRKPYTLINLPLYCTSKLHHYLEFVLRSRT